MAVVGCRACPSIVMAKVPWKACACIQGLDSVPGYSSRCKINGYLRKTGPLRRWSGLKEETLRGHSGKRGVQMFANSKADDSVPSEMSLENALKLLGVAEGASFEEILRAKNAILESNKDDQEVAAQVEAAYDMLLMQSLMQRRAGKVVDSSIRYADVKQLGISGIGGVPDWLKNYLKNAPVSIESPSVNDLGIQTGIYGVLMAWTFVSGVSYTGGGPLSNAGTDVPGLILATGFGASLYFLCKKNIKLGKATVITVGSLVAGAVLGGAVESWLQCTKSAYKHHLFRVHVDQEPHTRKKDEEDGFEVNIAKTSFKANTKALVENEGEGLAKLICCLEIGEILGVHILVLHATNLIHEASNAIVMGTQVYDIKFVIHAHAIFSEDHGSQSLHTKPVPI